MFQILLCFVLCITTGLPGQAEALKLSRSNAKKLVKDWCNGNDKQKEKADTKLRLTRPEDRFRIFEAFGAGVFVPDRKHQKLPREEVVRLPFKGGEMPEAEFIVQLPKKYKGKKPWPLLIRFHGSGDSGDNYASRWFDSPFSQKLITVTPTVPTEERGGWRFNGICSFFTELYRYLITRYNVDTDRVYFSGFSAGGAAAFYYPQSRPHLCAGFFARGRLWWNHHEMEDECMALMRHVPGFFLVGLNDKDERIEGFRRAEKYFTEHDFEAVFNFVKGRGHEYMGDYDEKGFSYLLERERVKYPKAFSGFYFMYQGMQPEEAFYTEHYWLKALRYVYMGTTCEVKADGNRITITTGKPGTLMKALVFLNDEIVNLDEPVVVTLDGEEAFNGRVERSVDYLLRWYEEHRDPRRLFWNEIEVVM